MLSLRACTIATIAFTTPSSDTIAATMNVSKTELLADYKLLENEGLAKFENGNVILTMEGAEMFQPTELDNEQPEVQVKPKQKATINSQLAMIGVNVTIKTGTRKEVVHGVYTNNPNMTHKEKNIELQRLTGQPARNCYVMQRNYELSAGLR